jgi:hypothetical protein
MVPARRFPAKFMQRSLRLPAILSVFAMTWLTASAGMAAAPKPPAPRPQLTLPALGEEVPLARIKTICEFYGLHDLWRKIERDPPKRPFKSDGCTGWFDDWKGVSLYPAGFLHDLKYWAGYPGEEVERLAADAELMIDVARLLGSTEMAETMFHGVRVGGSEKLNAAFSWGFGRKVVETVAPPRKTEPVPKPANATRQ